MPLYDYCCKACGDTQEHYAKVDEREQTCVCGGTATRIFSSRYFINPDIDYVTANITGDPVRITSRRQLDQMCKEHGVYQKIGKGWT